MIDKTRSNANTNNVILCSSHKGNEAKKVDKNQKFQRKHLVFYDNLSYEFLIQNHLRILFKFCYRNQRRGSRGKPSFVMAIIRTYGGYYMTGFFLMLIQSLLIVANPFILELVNPFSTTLISVISYSFHNLIIV